MTEKGLLRQPLSFYITNRSFYIYASAKNGIVIHMFKIINLVLFLSSTISFAQNTNSYPDLSLLDWLTGKWEYKTDENITVEKWEKLNARTFEGFAYVQKMGAEEPHHSEELRMLNMRGEIFYLAKVDHNEMPVPFKLVFSDADKFVFENERHDFPKQITYFRHGPDSIIVRVGDSSDTQPKFFKLYFSRKN
jgi:hypothetical protein